MSRASAIRAPATRDQVDAYRFGLRRLEAALVRGDPVPLHEQIRSQRRAAVAGALLGLLALGGVAVVAVVSPRPDWTQESVVVGAGSGAMYVVAHGPDRLVPVANLAAGRLVLAALRRGGGPATDPAAVAPVLVPDEALDRAPRTATAAVPGAVAVHPGGAGVPPRWAVCDQAAGDGSGPVATTVVAGAALPVPDTDPTTGALLAVPGGSTWLVTGGRRFRVDLADRPLLAAFGLTGRPARGASPGLVSALPEGPELATPAVPERGSPAPDGLPGRIGDVLVTRSIGGAPRHYAVLAAGLHEVPPVVAELLRVASGAGAAREIGPEVLARATLVDQWDVAGWPAVAPRLPGPAEAPYVCWTWTAVPGAEPTDAALVAAALPASGDAPTVALARADGAGERADAVVLGNGTGGPVRATGPGRPPGAGPLWLLSATGVGYGVPDVASAEALGITAAEPAPEVALRLLPTGPALDVAQAARVVDGLPAGG